MIKCIVFLDVPKESIVRSWTLVFVGREVGSIVFFCREKITMMIEN